MAEERSSDATKTTPTRSKPAISDSKKLPVAGVAKPIKERRCIMWTHFTRLPKEDDFAVSESHQLAHQPRRGKLQCFE
ncbi:hypothetical protein N7535_003489 [Penicillium sp. DV-2018c]|nr:hypothetical protein N7461_000809 [Penicillium sp. DV-2018c]KAJ5576563.1 hypothetical protein N7535_003489 [Penicillium sp. DV-2018c]